MVSFPAEQKLFKNPFEGNSWTLVTTILPFPISFSIITSDDSAIPTHVPSCDGNEPSHSMHRES